MKKRFIQLFMVLGLIASSACNLQDTSEAKQKELEKDLDDLIDRSVQHSTETEKDTIKADSVSE